jgi:hypothetical protein
MSEQSQILEREAACWSIVLPSALFRQRAWSRWVDPAANDPDARARLDALSRRLVLAEEQMPLWSVFVERLLKSLEAATAPDPGDGWDMGRSAALDLFLRVEIAAGRFLGAIEDARAAFMRLYAGLSPTQQRILDEAFGHAALR